MSDYSFVMDIIEDNNKELKEKYEKEKIEQEKESQDNTYINDYPATNFIDDTQPRLFDLQTFGDELYHKSTVRNKNYREYASNINAYDVAVNCIRTVVFKLLKTPITSYADKWLPVGMRSTVGNAIHDFIQLNSEQFTEKEACLKIPSIRFSGRLDGLINDNVLVEIKSVPFKDYKKIIKQNKPRTDDFYQTMCYKYVLENFTSEAKDPSIQTRNGVKPKLDNYKIKFIQFVYVAHDLIAHDIEDLNEALKIIEQLKSLLKSKTNQFYFITQLSINVEQCNDYEEFIKNKLSSVNYYLNNNKIPPMSDPFIDKKKCFFCPYQQVCRKH